MHTDTRYVFVCTQRQCFSSKEIIFKAITLMLGPGKTRNVSKEEIYLIQNLTVGIGFNIIITYFNILQLWFCIDWFFFPTFFSKQKLILCLSTFLLKRRMWRTTLTSSGCQKAVWLKTLSRSLKNTRRAGDYWCAEIL